MFSTFAYQLLTLLGLPGLPPSVQPATPPQGVPREPFTGWELDALLRRRAVENVQGSKETLESIVRLVDQIEGMPVGADVKGDIQDALAALNEVCIILVSSTVPAPIFPNHQLSSIVMFTRPHIHHPSRR